MKTHLNTSSLLAACVVSVGLMLSQGVAAKPARFVPEAFLPSDHQVLISKYKDINNDGFGDLLLISENIQAPREARLFQIIEGTAAGFKVHQNSFLIPCAKCGGPSEEPTFRSLKTSKMGFELQVYRGGIKNGYLTTLTFKFVPKRKDWFISKDVTIRFDDDHKQDSKYAVKRGKNYSTKNRIRFEDFDLNNL